MRIAIVGTGIAGLTAAHVLHPHHDLTLFEANDYPGGHTNTIIANGLAIDTGFIVYNDRTYPNFIRLLDRLGVQTQTSEMSFSVRSDQAGLEYNGGTLFGLFAQRRNLVRPSFLGMIRDIVRFNRTAAEVLEPGRPDQTLGEYLDANRYGDEFVRHYLVPMGAAIWSMPPEEMRGFPMRYFVRFFQNHGLLNFCDRPLWRVVTGGSQRYVEKLLAPMRDRLRLQASITAIRRSDSGVTLRLGDGSEQAFDHAVVATHGDQALRLLVDPTDDERRILSTFRTQENEAVLHTDTSLLPRRPAAWASWNYFVGDTEDRRATLTYLMNRLQSFESSETYCVTMNRSAAIRPERVVRKIAYRHPIYDTASVAAQAEWDRIAGPRTWYCGAYWGFGFHEDGVVSGLRVADRLGCRP